MKNVQSPRAESVYSQKKQQKKATELEERLNECEARLALMSKKIDEMENKFDQND